MSKYKSIVVSIAAIIIIVTLFVPPFFGKSDDGSFYNVLVGNGLYNSPSAENGYFSTVYGIEGAGDNTFMPITVAKLISGANNTFDIRWMGLVYLPLFMLGFALGIFSSDMRTKWVGLAVSILSLIVFVDIGYTSYFNSFYTEGLAITAVMMMVGAMFYLLKNKASYFALAVFGLGSLLLAFQSGKNAVICVLAAILVARCLTLKDRIAWKTTCIITSALILIGGLYISFLAPDYTKPEISKYDSVFNGILYESDNATNDLKTLGLPEKYAILAKTSYYDGMKVMDLNTEEFKNEFYDNISFGKVSAFYLKNPVRLFKNLNRAAQNTLFLRQEYIKNVQYDNYKLKPEPMLWSFARKLVIPPFLLYLIGFNVAILFFAIKGFKKRAGLSDGVIFLCLTGVIYFVEPVLFYGLSSISKNLIMFNMIFDILIIIAVAWFAQFLVDRRERLKTMYGVNQ